MSSVDHEWMSGGPSQSEGSNRPELPVDGALKYADDFDGPQAMPDGDDAAAAAFWSRRAGRHESVIRTLAAEVRRVRGIDEPSWDQDTGAYVIPAPDRDELVFLPAGAGAPLPLNGSETGAELVETTSMRERASLRSLIEYTYARLAGETR